MRLKNDFSGVGALIDHICEYYLKQDRQCMCVNAKKIGKGLDEGDHYFASFLIDNKHVIKYSIPTAVRTFAGLWVGFGPEYIVFDQLVSVEAKNKINEDSSTEAVEHNLKLLDDYFAKQTCCKCQNSD